MIAKRGGPSSLAELSTRSTIPKSSLVQLLQALEEARYVARLAGGYALGAGSHRLAAAIGAGHSAQAAARDALEALANSTRETALLGRFGPDRRSARYTDRVSSTQPVRFTPELDEPRPLHCTALGKVLLAWSPPAVAQQALRGAPLERFTDRTIWRKAALTKELNRVRSAGYARSIDEMVEGGGALAAPVLDAAGREPWALVIAAPSHRIARNETAWVELLTRHASELTTIRRGSAKARVR